MASGVNAMHYLSCQMMAGITLQLNAPQVDCSEVLFRGLSVRMAIATGVAKGHQVSA